MLEFGGFKHYSAEQLEIQSIASKLTPMENRFRLWLMNYTIDHGEPYCINAPWPKEVLTLGIDPMSTVKGLQEKNVLVLDDKEKVNFIYPVSALSTHHRVFLEDGREFCAMCAVDAMGTAFTFGQNVTIKSQCSQCCEEITVQIRDGRIVRLDPDTVHVLHVDLNKSNNWAGSC